MDSFTDIVRVATSRLKSANLYLATVQKMGGTSIFIFIRTIPSAYRGCEPFISRTAPTSSRNARASASGTPNSR